ncbi:hypothetical protein BN971_01857 [Mycobacterium bohemicum DSM 44277]|uniref:Uncharacterized protein n=1 Tax=Mycobacterium bohemicum DSM 44277 TaxID=1236609 RepID=A0A0U0W7F8_MYCBE|nr:hypothetical protein [Mycobacterium bohemicum]MCV6970064.1 hypothetical protein [Mycobacterium bohemicum]CPR10444.1 hypothetical protein BN971_01857 [Mycobacterium bohemicum DSM 44277]
MTRRDRDQRRPEKLSELLRNQTEAKWQEDPYLSSAGDGPGVYYSEEDQEED